ncbi:unnamed protein product [Urochloa humidicola]
MAWNEDYSVTSVDLGGSNLPECLQCGTLMFPRVDIDRPHVVHFLSFGFGAYKKMWVVSIDMSAKTVESSYLYMNGNETNDLDFIIKKSTSPLPFLPCEFPRFCYLSGLVGIPGLLTGVTVVISDGEGLRSGKIL